MTEALVRCGAKHTAYQPTDAEWKCPWCGTDPHNFYIDESAENVDEYCTKLHKRDQLVCFKCQEGLSGQVFANKVALAKNKVTCPECNGEGTVTNGAAKKLDKIRKWAVEAEPSPLWQQPARAVLAILDEK